MTTSTSTEREIPPDFPAGWQNVRHGETQPGDRLVYRNESGGCFFYEIPAYDAACIGVEVEHDGTVKFEETVYNVYRRIPTPKQGTEDHKAIVESVCQEAHRLVMGDRQAFYNHPAKDFDLCARYWSVLFDIKVKPEQVGMAMILVKLAREMHRHKRDNCTDMAGYAQTIEMVHEERNKEPDFP